MNPGNCIRELYWNQGKDYNEPQDYNESVLSYGEGGFREDLVHSKGILVMNEFMCNDYCANISLLTI